MVTWFLHPARLVATAILEHASPRELAWGAALGMMLGLVPKGNLTALVLAILLFSLRANIAAGLLSAFVFSWIGMLLDPAAHRLGWQILSYRPLQPLYAWCYELPLAPWSGLNNTIVLGQLVLGLYAFVPIHWLTQRGDARWRPVVAEAIRKYRAARLLSAAELASRLELGE